MSGPTIIQTADIEQTFRAIKNRQMGFDNMAGGGDYKRIPYRNYAPGTTVGGGLGNGMAKFASGVMYGQPQFFSPVHTPINWQIPSKRLEQYQWMFLPNTHVLMDDYTYGILEQNKFDYEIIVQDEITGGLIFEANNYPSIMNSEGVFNQPPRISIRDCIDKVCYGFKPIGNYRKLEITEEHCIFVLDGKAFRKHKKLLGDRKYKKLEPIDNKGPQSFIKRVRASEVNKKDYLLTPIPSCGTETIDPDLAWLIGYCVADGTISCNDNSYRVAFTGQKGEKCLDECFKILRENFDGAITSKPHGDGKGWRVVLGRKQGNSFFKKYINGKGTNKKFSKNVFEFDYETRLQILAGYVDGDGSFNKDDGRITINCYSEDLINQVYWLMLSCGINNSMVKYNLGKNHYPTSSTCYYRITIPSSCVDKIGINLKGNKIPSNTIAKKERELKFFHEEGGVKYFVQPIQKIDRFLYTGNGFDIEMTNERKALVAEGYVCSNSRFFYTSEPKVASAIDFYSKYPVGGWTHECRNQKVKLYFDRLVKRLNLHKWVTLISHEVHLLGDCFPLVEISCEHCHGLGRIGGDICEHEGGTIRRIMILNPDYVDVLTTPTYPEPVIILRPDEELLNMVQKKMPGHEKLSPEVVKLITSGQPIPLDNRSVAHLKYGECGYSKFGVGMIRRLFPILSYKTKLMVAQWIVAERLIVPIRIVKVGSDERPAGAADIDAVKEQLAQTANDPNLTIVTQHAFELMFEGASGKILTLSNEFEFINQEILDGLMINNALLNGEGPTFGSASVGIEAMIHRLKTFQGYVADWMEEFIYLPEAKRQGFIDENPETEEDEWIVPKIKWDKMHLRDQQQDKQFAMQLYEKGLLSAHTVLEVFGYDPDMEIERKRYDAIQMMALGQGFTQGGAEGGAGGAGGMGGMGGGMGGMGDMGGGMGGEPPIGAPDMGGGMGEAPASPMGGAPSVAKTSTFVAEIANPQEFGGRVLKKRNREKFRSERDRHQHAAEAKEKSATKGADGQMRDEKGRIIFTQPERKLMDHIIQYQKDGLIKYPVQTQYRVQLGGQEYPLDFALPHLQICLEADGEVFHSAPKQVMSDKERDAKLTQAGWIVLRFTDEEIEKRPQQIMSTIMKTIMKKEMALNALKKNKK